ncbi:MAG TPA: hypothetical protein VFW35_04010 [Sphingomicrobium sp.]|nr:hypothetical protein [Sphingomicrobium sp.]
MDLKTLGIAALVLGASACTQSQPQNRSRELPASSRTAQPSKPPVQPAPRPSPTLDPKSSESAVELVKGFARLLNQHKFDEAYMLLGPAAPPRSEFDKQFSRYSDLEVSVGAPGDQEGAAGSIYLSVPLTVSGDTGGERTSRFATAILRRVNDVPGSTEAQRRWHIERIDWGSAP